MKSIENKPLPLVTVIMTVFNRANSQQSSYARKAVESVLAQDYPNFELLVINDCSTDNSGAVLDELSAQDERMRVIHNGINLGQQASLNIALANSRGKYVANLDGDNLWLGTDKIAKQVAWLEENPEYVLVGGGIQIIDKDGNRGEVRPCAQTDEQIRERILLTNEFGASCVMYPRELALKLGGYPRDRRFSRDLGLWLQMGLHGKMANLPHVWHGHRITGTNIGELLRKEQLQDALYYITKHRHDYPNFRHAWIRHIIQITLFSIPVPVINVLRKIKHLWK